MKIFFIGIKGSGMSSLAQILKNFGNTVIGSDIEDKVFTEEKLRKNEIEIFKFGEYDFSKGDIDYVVIGNAFSLEDIDAKNASKYNIKIVNYFSELSSIITEKNSIAISGTNGKTTTTSLLVESMNDIKPSYLIGDGSGFGNLDSDLFIFEACEYRETFLAYHPKYLLINNIEMDHPDFFENEQAVVQTFQKFANQAEYIILNADDSNCMKIKHDNIYTFGFSLEANLRVKEVRYGTGGINVILEYQGEIFPEIELPFFGEHMLYNSLGVILINLILGKKYEEIIQKLRKFKGANRRFSEKKLNEKEVILIDDYAHHPTSIKLTIEAIRQKYPEYELTAIFQPHTYSRTITFLDEFSETLVLADNIILADIFGSAREKNGDIDIKILENKICETNPEKIKDKSFLTGNEENHIICLLGAGNIDLLYKEKIIILYSK